MGTRVLVVDDEDTLRMVISQVLEEDGYDVTTAASGEEALDLFRQSSFPIVVTDIIMGKMSGLELLQEVKVLDSEALVVVITSQASVDRATAAIRSGAYDFLTKPFDELDVISAVVNRADEKVRLLQRNKTLMVSLKKHTEELERLNSSLEDLAIHDGLTGLHNHRYFRDSLDQELSRSSRHERPFSLVFMDVDHFKKFNDEYGHEVGDQVLRMVAAELERVGGGGTPYRYGGEEFALLFPGKSAEEVVPHLERVRESIETATFTLRGAGRPKRRPENPKPGRNAKRKRVSVTVSIGAAGRSDRRSAPSEVASFADRALYRAKKTGRNRVKVAGGGP